MNDAEQMQKMAKELATKAESASVAELATALEKVTQTYKSLSDVEKAQAEIRKLAIDEQKARYDLEHASKQERSEKLQRYFTIFAPIATVAVLGSTLVLQTFQFVASERDKREAAEDAQWSDAVKTVAQTTKQAQVAIALNPFLKSKRYADRARKTAVQVLVQTHDPAIFADLFRGAFVPVDWGNFDGALQLDRQLGTRLGDLASKSFNDATQTNDLSRLSDDERNEYYYTVGALRAISEAIVPLLKRERPNGQHLDLRSAWFQECNWSGADLRAADIENIKLRYANLKGADLSGITSFLGADFFRTAWWEVNRISPDFLDYLVNGPFRYDSAKAYGPTDARVSQQDYETAIARLKAAK